MTGSSERNMAPACPVCRGTDLEVLGLTQVNPLAVPAMAPRQRTVKRCRCGVIAVEPLPTGEQLADYYSRYASQAASDGDRSAWRRRTAFGVVEAIAMKVGGGRILDAGCGSGELLAALPARFEKYGVDISAEACRQAASHGIKMTCSSILAAGFDCTFDIVVALDIIEHVPDPAPVIKRLSELLAPGGYLIIQTGNAESFAARILGEDWAYTAVFGHLYAFGPASIRMMFEDAGMHVVAMQQSHHIRAPLHTSLWYNCRAYTFHAYRRLCRMAGPLVSRIGLLNRAYCHHPPAVLSRDHLTCVGQKRAADTGSRAATDLGLMSLPPNPNRLCEGGLRLRGVTKQSRKDEPLVSIVTVVFNGEKFLGSAIRSVADQSYGNIEYIVIDGGSRDGSVDIIRKHEESIDYWASEPDDGISDAFNKGISLARGEFVGLLNADDWLSPDQVAAGVRALAASDRWYAFGDLLFHDPEGKPLYRIKGDAGYASAIRRRLPDMNHPTVLARRELFVRIGGFDAGLHVAMDYEWLLRAHVRGFDGLYVPDLVGHMRLAGRSDDNYRDACREVRDISIRYGYSRRLANLSFAWRTSKTGARRLMESVLPAGFPRWIRSITHPGFRTVRGGQ